MARKPAPPAEETETVKASDVVGVTPERKLKALLKKSKDTRRDTSELAGQLGQAVANAVENDHLHRKAFNITKQLHQMEDEKLAECMMHLEHYLEAGGINARVAKVGRLPLGDNAEPAATEAEEGSDDTKGGLRVHQGGRGREVAEAAGA